MTDPGPAGSGDLQPALPRPMYVDERTFARERDRVLFGEWFCVGRTADLGLAEPGRVAVVDVRRGVRAAHQRRAG